MNTQHELNERPIYGNGGTVRLSYDPAAPTFSVAVELTDAEPFTLTTADGTEAIEFYDHALAYLPADRLDPFSPMARARAEEGDDPELVEVVEDDTGAIA